MGGALSLSRLSKDRSRPVSYAIATGMVALTTVVGLVLQPLLHGDHMLFLFLAAAVLAGLFLGTGSSAVALGLGALAAMFLFPRPGATPDDSHDLTGLALYLMAGGLLAWLAE